VCLKSLQTFLKKQKEKNIKREKKKRKERKG